MIPDKNISFTPLAMGTISAGGGVMTGVKAGDTLRLVVNVYVRPNTGSDHDTGVNFSVNGAVLRYISMVPTYRTSGNPTLLLGAYVGFYTANANNPSYLFSANGGTVYEDTNGIWEVVR